MKASVTILSLALATMSLASHADNSSVTKSQTHIDFNKMIDDNNSDQSDLQKTIDQKNAANAPADQDKTVTDDKKKVLDFVDVEVGVGQDRPVVDRRFN